MRSLHLLVCAAGFSLAAVACGGGDGGSGPGNQNPTAAFGHSCDLLDCSFTDASTDPDGNATIATYDWDFGDQSAHATTKDAAHTYTAPGAYHVKLQVTDNAGASSTVADSLVSVSDVANNTNPTAEFTWNCASLDCTFTDGSSDPDAGDGIATRDWNFGDGSPHSSEQNPTHSFTATATTSESVTLTVTDNHGGVGTVTHNDVSVSPPAGLTCDNGSGTFVSCPLHLDVQSTVTITVTASDCTAHHDALKITSPIQETIFSDGCNTIKVPVGTVYTVNGGAAFGAGTDLEAQVTSGSTDPDRVPPAIHVTGPVDIGGGVMEWTLNFDDGEDPTNPNEPDFNDLVLKVDATPSP